MQHEVEVFFDEKGCKDDIMRRRYAETEVDVTRKGFWDGAPWLDKTKCKT